MGMGAGHGRGGHAPVEVVHVVSELGAFGAHVGEDVAEARDDLAHEQARGDHEDREDERLGGPHRVLAGVAARRARDQLGGVGALGGGC